MFSFGGSDFSQKETSRLKRKKILSVYYRHKPGGLCRRLYMMFDALLAEGAEIHYIAVEKYPISHARIVPHILWSPFKKKEGVLFWFYFVGVMPFYCFIIGRREQVDLVSVFGAVYGFFAIFLKLLVQTPLVIFVRADAYEIGRILNRPLILVFFEEVMTSVAFKLSDRIVSVSPQLRKTIFSRYKIQDDKVDVLQNNIQDFSGAISVKKDVRRKLHLDVQAFIIVTAAVLDARKNIDFLIQAAAFVKQPAVFIILGEGPDRAHLIQLAKQVGKQENIFFPGWREDVGDFFSAADLFVLPSRHEGCSNALLEALSQGLPCLCSDIPENRSVLKSDELLFDPIDLRMLSDKLNKMMDSAYLERAKGLSEDARKRLIFNWDHRVVTIHQGLLAQRELMPQSGVPH